MTTNLNTEPEVEAVATAYDKLAPKYDATFKGKVALAENHVFFKWANSVLHQHGQTLELGCGTGLVLEEMPFQFWEYTGVDISIRMLREAKRKFPDHNLIRMDMAKVGRFMPDEGFDQVISTFGSLSYCMAYRDALRGSYHSLRRGGKIAVGVFSPRYHTRQSHICKGELSIVTFDQANLRYQLEAAGFQEVQTWGFSMGLLEKLQWLPQPLLNRYAEFETNVLAPLFPHLCYFTVAIGTKPCHAKK